MPRNLLTLLVLATSTLVAAPAFADQCAWVEPAVAKAAAVELASGRRIVEFCEPCKEPRPSAKRTLGRNAAVRDVPRHPEYKQVDVDGKLLDIAYLFVERKPGIFENVALISGCPAVSVSRELQLP
jgi:hypothetical protein